MFLMVLLSLSVSSWKARLNMIIVTFEISLAKVKAEARGIRLTLQTSVQSSITIELPEILNYWLKPWLG